MTYNLVIIIRHHSVIVNVFYSMALAFSFGENINFIYFNVINNQ